MLCILLSRSVQRYSYNILFTIQCVIITADDALSQCSGQAVYLLSLWMKDSYSSIIFWLSAEMSSGMTRAGNSKAEKGKCAAPFDYVLNCSMRRTYTANFYTGSSQYINQYSRKENAERSPAYSASACTRVSLLSDASFCSYCQNYRSVSLKML